MLRAKHRKVEFGVNSEQWPFPELPHISYKRCDMEDIMEGEPAKLTFNLMPASFELLPGEHELLLHVHVWHVYVARNLEVVP